MDIYIIRGNIYKDSGAHPEMCDEYQNACNLGIFEFPLVLS